MGRAGLFIKPFWDARLQGDANAVLNLAVASLPPVQQLPRLPKQSTRAEKAAHKLLENAEKARVQGDRARAIYTDTKCKLCGADDGDIIHLCTVCTNATIAARRNAKLTNFPVIIITMLESLRAAHKLVGAAHGLVPHAGTLTPDQGEGHFLLTRLITCAEWPASVVPDAWLIAKEMGTLLDRYTPIPQSRKVADAWARAAIPIINDICMGWTEALPPAAARALVIAGHRYSS